MWDSVPENEYVETVNKAKALLKAIRTAEAMFPAKEKNSTLRLANADYFVTPAAAKN